MDKKLQELSCAPPTDRYDAFPPVRKIPRKYGSYRGYLPSVAMLKSLKYESRSGEKKLYKFLDFLSILGLVKTIHPQPVSIEYLPGRYYTPDTLVFFAFPWLKPWLIEAKGKNLGKEKLQQFKPQFKGAIRFAKANGYIFHIVTSALICRLDDDIFEFLKTHRGKSVPSSITGNIIDVLKEYGPMPPCDVIHLCSQKGITDVPIKYIWQLASDGIIFCDLTRPASQTFVAAPVAITIPYLSRKSLFQIPFSLVGGK